MSTPCRLKPPLSPQLCLSGRPCGHTVIAIQPADPAAAVGAAAIRALQPPAQPPQPTPPAGCAGRSDAGAAGAAAAGTGRGAQVRPGGLYVCHTGRNAFHAVMGHGVCRQLAGYRRWGGGEYVPVTQGIEFRGQAGQPRPHSVASFAP